MKKNVGWTDIYQKKGIVQNEVLPKVVKLENLFKKKKFETILDLGCGTGRHSIYLSSQGFQVTATDISEVGLKLAEKNAVSQGITDIAFQNHDMKTIPFTDNAFDAVLCILVIDHGTLADIAQTVNEVYRVLKKGGMFMVDFLSAQDETFGRGIKIEENTFLNSIENEKGIIHHYTSENEIQSLFNGFDACDIVPCINTYYKDNGDEYHTHAFDVMAFK